MSKTTIQLVIGASYINKDDGSRFELDAADLTDGEVRLVRHYGPTTSFALHIKISEMEAQFSPMSQPEKPYKPILIRDDKGVLVNPGDTIMWMDRYTNMEHHANVVRYGNSLFATWEYVTGQVRINLRSLRRQVGRWYKIANNN